MIPDCCTDLPFDTAILGRPVWRLNDPVQAEAASQAAVAADIGLMTRRGAASEAPALSPYGFRHVETLVTFEGPMPKGAAPPSVRLATPDDADAVAEIARTAFHADRWHADPMIANDKADAFKAEWARNNVLGRADAVLVATGAAGVIEGFNAVLVRNKALVIDLIAVAGPAQGRGVGRALIGGVSLVPCESAVLRVGTQRANAASIALYRAFGLSEAQTANTWHWTGPRENT